MLPQAADDLVLLQTCSDSAEANALKARLEAEGIPAVVQGEHHHAMLGGVFGGAIELRLLVPARAEAEARALLEAEPIDDAGSLTPADGEAACKTHGAKSVGTCSRCGSFVCDACAAGTEESPLCLDCEERLATSQPSRASRRRLYGWIAIGIFFGIPAALLALLTLLRIH